MEENYLMDKNNERPLKIIYFYLTEGCNLKCRHCWLAPAYDEDGKKYPTLDINLFESIIKQAKPMGLKSVRLTGGEPLLHPDIYRMLDVIKTEDLRLSMESNAVLMTEEIAEKIAQCKNPFVSVSLDGATSEAHEYVRGVEGSFQAAITGIKNLVNYGIRPQIIMTIMKHNRPEIEDIIKLAKSIGAKSVKFNIVQPASRGEKMHKDGKTLSIEELIELGRFVESDLSEKLGIPLYYSHPPAFRSLKKLFGDGERGCSVCGLLSVIGVIPNGLYALCGIGQVIPELIFGDAKTESLKEVWENADILNELREGMPSRLEGICGNCIMNNSCKGACLAQNYYSKRNLWAPFWFCEEADKKGLFPKTRKIIPDLQKASF